MIVNLKTVVPDGLSCPEGKRRIEYCDTGGTGLYVEVRATSPGQGTYYLRWKQNGKTCHEKIGRTTDIDLDEARQRAKTLKAKITLYGNTRGDEEVKPAVPMTLDVLFQEHYMPHAKAHNRGWKKKSQMYNLQIKKAFGNKRLDQIKRHDISSWHVALREDGLSPAYSDRFLALLRHALNLAVEWDMLEKNPSIGVKKFNIDNRTQYYLQEEDLKRLLKVLQTDKNRTPCLIALWLLASGARLGSALRCKWEHIDRSNKVWRIPAANAKSKRIHSVPLNDCAIDILDQLDTEEKYEYLFINRMTGKPYTTIQKAWNRLRTNAGLPHLRVHDLRHAAASYMAQSGIDLWVIAQVLNHSDVSMTQRYAHLSTKTLQEAADRTSDVIKGAMPKSPQVGPGE